MKVGGIRISHMSDIQGDLVMALMASNKKKAVATIKPLAQQAQRPTGDEQVLQALVNKLLTSAQSGMAHLEAGWKALTPDARKALKAELPALKKIAEEADAADDFNSPPAPQSGAPTAEAGLSSAEGEAVDLSAEGPADEQRGEEHNGADSPASAWIDRYEADLGKAKSAEQVAKIHREADYHAATIKADFPELYAARLDGIRPVDAPERASGLFGGRE
jgi:hypothetical protein